MTEEQAKSLALAVCVAACAVFSCLSVAGADGSSVAYPLEGYIENYNPYVQQFDAFQKGQLHIDVEPEPELLELANPYDPAQRQGIYYLWDRALYNGKYYSYFGVTPILTVYYPFYLAMHSLPSETTVKMIYSLMTALFLPLAVFELAKLTGKGYRRGRRRWRQSAQCSQASLSLYSGAMRSFIILLCLRRTPSSACSCSLRRGR